MGSTENGRSERLNHRSLVMAQEFSGWRVAVRFGGVFGFAG